MPCSAQEPDEPPEEPGHEEQEGQQRKISLLLECPAVEGEVETYEREHDRKAQPVSCKERHRTDLRTDRRGDLGTVPARIAVNPLSSPPRSYSLA
jgi:hypothetical protein